MAADETCARLAGTLAKALGMMSPDLSPFLRQLGPHQGRPFMPTPAVAVGPFGGGARTALPESLEEDPRQKDGLQTFPQVALASFFL